MLTCKGSPGEHISKTVERAIAIAEKFNRKVRIDFNGIKLVVNKRLSVSHVVNTFKCMSRSRNIHYQRSPEALAYKNKRVEEITTTQVAIDTLVSEPPTTKENSAKWLSEWIPLSDDIDIDRRGDEVCTILKGLGFFANQNVGAPEFKRKTASPMMFIEYVAGQVIDMLERAGCVHPMLGDWAKDAARAIDNQV